MFYKQLNKILRHKKSKKVPINFVVVQVPEYFFYSKTKTKFRISIKKYIKTVVFVIL